MAECQSSKLVVEGSSPSYRSMKMSRRKIDPADPDSLLKGCSTDPPVLLLVLLLAVLLVWLLPRKILDR